MGCGVGVGSAEVGVGAEVGVPMTVGESHGPLVGVAAVSVSEGAAVVVGAVSGCVVAVGDAAGSPLQAAASRSNVENTITSRM